MNVFFTGDVEISLDGWDRLDDGRFSGVFRRYFYSTVTQVDACR